MKVQPFIFTFLLFLFGCKSKQDPKIRGEIKIELTNNMFNRLKGTYFYLYELSSKRVIDSVLVKDKVVLFKASVAKNTNPIFVKVKCWEFRNGIKHSLPIGFIYKAPNVVYSHFYIDKSKTFIKAFDILNNEESFFEGSSQNVPFFLNIELRYPGKDSIKNLVIRKHNINIIKQYPNSDILLLQLYSYKEYFPIDELKYLLNKFDTQVKDFDLYTRMQTYLSDPIDFNKKYPSFIPFENFEGKTETVDTNIQKLHLIVFWASWCGPCRKEIPELLKLYNNYSKKGFKITSISIDTDRQLWKNALMQENMPWKQLLAIDDSRQLLDKNYAINAIPKSFLFDDKNKLITSFKGFDSSFGGKVKMLIEVKK